MKIIIEKATTGDLRDILELQKIAFLQEAVIHDDYQIPPLLQTLEEMEAEFQTRIFLKAMYKHLLIGSVRGNVVNKTGYIGRLMVSPDYQNQGIGRQLVQAMEKELCTQRYEIFTSEKSSKNLYLYTKLGYKAFKTEKILEKITIVYLEKHQVVNFENRKG